MRLSKVRWSGILTAVEPLIPLIVLCVGLTLTSPYFLTPSNLLNVAKQSSVNAILAIGMTFVIITAGIDLSVGSQLALTSVVMCGLINRGMNMILAMMVGILLGLAMGVVSGIAISKAKIPPFIVTLGMMNAARGLALVYAEGRPISVTIPAFRFLGTGYVGAIPASVIVALVIAILAHYILSNTKHGRYVYALGSNPVASRLSGINVDGYQIAVYALSGMTSALGGVVFASRLGSAQPIAGLGYELDAIAACVIGGTSLMGGEGTIAGTMIGALTVGVLRNGLNLLNVSTYWQQVTIGVVIVLAVLTDIARKSARARSQRREVLA